MNREKQVSESLTLGIFLALAGGFMDAYSYVCRGEVFANAQTGNILLFGIHISKGEFPMALRYLCPILAFALGIVVSDVVKHYLKEKKLPHWRQVTILFEAVVLVAVGFMAQKYNLLANSMTSFACGIQVESFRKIHGKGIATTMCIGNLRTGTEAMCDYRYTKNPKYLKKGLLFYGVIGCFVLGAIFGNQCVGILQEKAIMICSVILLVGFLLMFRDREKKLAE